jgi:hypothetical protein
MKNINVSISSVQGEFKREREMLYDYHADCTVCLFAAARSERLKDVRPCGVGVGYAVEGSGGCDFVFIDPIALRPGI